jgi:DNA repair photolyase
VKQNARELVARELQGIAPRGEHIAIGTATDPYQPVEGEFRVTRAILEEMARCDGLNISITTKSNRITRDLDLLQHLSKKSSVSVNVTITTPRPRLARLLEPRAPRPDLRFAAVRALRDAGLPAGIFVMPVLPGITDRQQDLDALARLARDAGAQWFRASVLFLMPSSRNEFMPFLEQQFPRLAQRYRDFYEKHAYAPDSYRWDIGRQFSELRRKYGFPSSLPASPRPAPASRQLALAI